MAFYFNFKILKQSLQPGLQCKSVSNEESTLKSIYTIFIADILCESGCVAIAQSTDDTYSQRASLKKVRD